MSALDTAIGPGRLRALESSTGRQRAAPDRLTLTGISGAGPKALPQAAPERRDAALNLGTIRAAALEGYAALASSLGLNVVQQMKRVGLPLESLLDAELPISCDAFVALLEQSAADARCPDFGLQLAQHQGLDVLGPVRGLVAHAPTLQEAIESARRYLFVHCAALELSTLPGFGGQWCDLVVSTRVPMQGGAVQATELALGVLVRSIAMLSQNSVVPLALTLPHDRCADIDRYAQVLGARCLFGLEHAAVRLKADDLRRPLPHSDPVLWAMARRYLETRFSDSPVALAERVRSLVRQLLGTGQATQGGVAVMLSMHPRTLQRRLAAEGSNFEAVKDEARREQLLALLARGDMRPIASLAVALDYSEPSALTRSCRRWFGITPSVLRQSLARA